MADLRIHVTPTAARQIKTQLARRPQTNARSGVRVGVKGERDRASESKEKRKRRKV